MKNTLRSSAIILVFSLLLSVMGLTACNEKPIDRNSFKQELENRKVVRANDGQIIQIAKQKGSKLLDTLQSAFEKYAQSSQKGNWKCTLDSIALVSYLKTTYGIRSSKVGIWKSDTLSLIGQVLQAYVYARFEGQTLEDNLQRVGTDTFLVTRPWIWDENASCATCHNVSIKQAAIIAMYIPKKEIIKSITAKDLKSLPQP